MDRVQRSGLITLLLLLGVAGAGLVLGSLGPAAAEEQAPGSVTVETEELLRAALVPPQKRRALSAADFQRPPVRHPLRGGTGRDVNLPVEHGASGAAVLDLGPPPAPGRDGGALDALRRVRVRDGETLQSISQRQLGTSRRWGEIASLNGIRDPRMLRVGQELWIPASGAAAPPAGEAYADSPVAGGAGTPPREYVVRDGDTASEISQRVYGTSRHWQRILEANGIRDPARLRAGQTLRIPAQP